MRSDTTLPADEFRRSTDWVRDPFTGTQRPELVQRYSRGKAEVDGRLKWHSFSGHERNRLFASDRGTTFWDVSALSGADQIADSRSIALLDFDRDGRQDLLVANASFPLLNLYQNQIPLSTGGVIALKFVGSNRTAQRDSHTSARDPYGVKIWVTAGNRTWLRELRCGEGFAAQNSDTMLVGMGKAQRADRFVVRWPSGKEQTFGPVNVGRLVELHEPVGPTSGDVFVHPYFRPRPENRQPVQVAHATAQTLGRVPVVAVEPSDAGPADPSYYVYITIATWCTACRAHLPQMQLLAEQLQSEDVAIVGIPVDRLEPPEELLAYGRKHLPFPVAASISDPEREAILNRIESLLHSTAQPATLVLARDGTVLAAMAGVPTLSKFRQQTSVGRR